MILWDSRTVHMGLSASRGRAHSYRFRSVVYVCYRPRSAFTKAELERRKKYVEIGATTNHWGTVKFAPKPWRRGHVEDEPEPREYQQVELGLIGLSLI